MIFSDLDTDGALDFSPNSPEIVQTNTYYPFGMLIEGMHPIDQTDPSQPYRYNGKELTLMGGLYDYGFRHYDPMIGRFIGVDPIADRFPHVNVYNYAENEPIANIDLWGLQAVRAENYVTSWTANKMAANNGKSYAQNFQDLKQNESGGDQIFNWIHENVLGNDAVSAVVTTVEVGTEGKKGEIVEIASKGSKVLGPVLQGGDLGKILYETNPNDPQSMESGVKNGAEWGVEFGFGLFCPVAGIPASLLIMTSQDEGAITNPKNIDRAAGSFESNFNQRQEVYNVFLKLNASSQNGEQQE